MALYSKINKLILPQHLVFDIHSGECILRLVPREITCLIPEAPLMVKWSPFKRVGKMDPERSS